MAERICAIPDCDNKVIARGWCPKHYCRWQAHGTTDDPPPFQPAACSVDGCDRPSRKRGWCSMHYQRWCAHGHLGYKWPSVSARFWAKVNKTETCWLWTAATTSGYGAFGRGPSTKDGMMLAHRFAYEEVVGPIPDGLTIDHLCRVKLCVNPAHMEPVTLAENTRRAKNPPPFTP